MRMLDANIFKKLGQFFKWACVLSAWRGVTLPCEFRAQYGCGEKDSANVLRTPWSHGLTFGNWDNIKSALFSIQVFIPSTWCHTINFPEMMIQTYLIEFTWQGKLFQMIDPPQSDPLLSVHYLIGFRLFWNDLWRGFSFYFSLLPDYGIGQSVTLLIGDIRCSVKANDQTKTCLYNFSSLTTLQKCK